MYLCVGAEVLTFFFEKPTHFIFQTKVEQVFQPTIHIFFNSI
jgi:hypothetical protein